MMRTMDKREVVSTIAAELAKGEVAFPTGAQVAMKVRQALDHPECHIDAATKLVQAEPLLAARAVAMANSVVFNPSGREISDVRSSVARLGFRTLRSLATALVARQMAGNQLVEPYQGMAAVLWRHTTHVASLAHVIARRITRLDPETALFIGIVHEVGGFYLLSRAKDFPGLLDGDLDFWGGIGEAELGRAVLGVLAVPPSVLEAMELYWDGFLSMPPKTLADTLLLAEELAPVASPLHALGGEGQGEGMSASIQMAIGDETLTSILAESNLEVESLIAALQF